MKAYRNSEGIIVEAAAIHACHPEVGPVEVVELVAPSEDKPRVFVDPSFSASGRPAPGDAFVREQGSGIAEWMAAAVFQTAFTAV